MCSNPLLFTRVFSVCWKGGGYDSKSQGALWSTRFFHLWVVAPEMLWTMLCIVPKQHRSLAKMGESWQLKTDASRSSKSAIRMGGLRPKVGAISMLCCFLWHFGWNVQSNNPETVCVICTSHPVVKIGHPKISGPCLEIYEQSYRSWFPLTCGYGSIPLNTIFRGMNIYLPAILMFTRGTRFWHTAMYIYHGNGTRVMVDGPNFCLIPVFPACWEPCSGATKPSGIMGCPAGIFFLCGLGFLFSSLDVNEWTGTGKYRVSNDDNDDCEYVFSI